MTKTSSFWYSGNPNLEAIWLSWAVAIIVLREASSIRFKEKRADDRIRGESGNKNESDEERVKSETGLKKWEWFEKLINERRINTS